MSWDYRCLNCKAAYRIFQRGNHICPKCGSDRARWVPGGIAVRKVATGIDKTVRGLAQQFGMSDIRSAKEGETRAAPREATRAIDWGPAGGNLGKVRLPYDQNGQFGTANLPYNGAVCSPAGVWDAINPDVGRPIGDAAKRRAELKNMTQTVARYNPR